MLAQFIGVAGAIITICGECNLKLVRQSAKRLRLRGGQSTMVVTVIAVGMVQMPVDKIIDMIAVGHSFMAATGAVSMAGLVATTVVRGGTGGRICGIDTDHMFLNTVRPDVVQMAVVEVVGVAIMSNRGMATGGTVLVRVCRSHDGISWVDGITTEHRQSYHPFLGVARHKNLQK